MFKEMVGFRLSKSDIAEIDQIAELEEITRSQALDFLVRHGITQYYLSKLPEGKPITESLKNVRLLNKRKELVDANKFTVMRAFFLKRLHEMHEKLMTGYVGAPEAIDVLRGYMAEAEIYDEATESTRYTDAVSEFIAIHKIPKKKIRGTKPL